MTGIARTRAYRKGVLDAEGFSVDELSEQLDQADTIVWVDLCDPSREQLDVLADELEIHELAVEDALEPHQRPKLDRYDSHLFLSCHAVRINDDHTGLEEAEIDAFVSERWLVTVRKDDRFPIEPVFGRCDRSPDLMLQGTSFLLYSLLDVVVDGYFDTVEAFDEFYDVISEGIFADQPLDPTQQQHWFEMRRALVRFHRLVVPLREAVSALMRREHGVVDEALYPYFQDVYDHILRVSESTDSLRDLVATIVETNLSLREYRQNQIMKKVTSWAAIIAVPTLVTGFYGMNVPYPGSGDTSGAIVSTVLVVLLSGGLFASFRRRDWL